MENITVARADVSHSADIARLIMLAMSDDCCRYLAGENHTLDDFRCMMERLVRMDDSQYSWRNALVAVDGGGHVAGACVAYDGADLHRLRRRFIGEARESLQRDFAGMDDETFPGEFYIDSLAVCPQYRRRGIAASLLKAMAQRAFGAGLPAALLVDKQNPNAERLYSSLGFRHVGDAGWGGHEMRRLHLTPATATF